MIILAFIELFQNSELKLGFGGQLYIFFITYNVTLSFPFVIYLNYLLNDKHQRISPMLTSSQHQRMFGLRSTKGIATISKTVPINLQQLDKGVKDASKQNMITKMKYSTRATDNEK